VDWNLNVKKSVANQNKEWSEPANIFSGKFHTMTCMFPIQYKYLIKLSWHKNQIRKFTDIL